MALVPAAPTASFLRKLSSLLKLLGGINTSPLFNEALVNHAQNSGRFRYSRSCGGYASEPRPRGLWAPGLYGRRCSLAQSGSVSLRLRGAELLLSGWLGPWAAQHTAHLVIAPQVFKVSSQKHITPFAGNAFHDAGFQIFGLHIIPCVFPRYDI